MLETIQTWLADSGLGFKHPHFLWLWLLLPVLMLAKGRIGKSVAIVFSSTAIAQKVSSNSKSNVGNFLFFTRILALFLLIFAMARPQKGEDHTEVEASGIDIMLGVDVSGSMAALDFSEDDNIVTRLDAVKKVLEKFVEKRPNDRIGLIAFAKEPYLVSPLTLNHDWLLANLERLSLDLIDGSQTAIGTAIAMCTNRMRDVKAKERIVILLTDGEETSHLLEPIPAAEAARNFKLKIYTIAAGKVGRVPMPYMDNDGNIQRDFAGRVRVHYQMSNVDEPTLKRIAELTQAQYFRATDEEELENIYTVIDELEKTEVKLRQYATYEELFTWPVILGLLLLGLEQLLVNTRFRKLP